MHTSYSSSWSVGGTAVLVDVSGDLSRNWPLRQRGEIRCSILNRKQGELGQRRISRRLALLGGLLSRSKQAMIKTGRRNNEPHLPVRGRRKVRDFDQFFGARCSMIEIVRNRTAAIAMRIHEPFVLSISWED
jgi:hypothetical protein